MSDKSYKDRSTVEDMLNSVLSEAVWGIYKKRKGNKSSASEFEILSKEPSCEPPHVKDVNESDIISYGEFLELTMDRGPMRRLAKTSFTDGDVGLSFKPHLKILQNHLRLENDVKDEDKDEDKDERVQYEHMHYVVPAFYKLLIELKEKNIDFDLILRSFGHDIDEVVHDVNLFFDGRHPQYGNMGYLPSKKIQRRGLLKRLNGGKIELKATRDIATDEDEATSLISDNVGNAKAYSDTLSSWLQTGSVAIQDDFPYWRDHGESDDAGKLLVLDREKEGISELTFFIDDNIERDRAHIVSVVYSDSMDKTVPFVTTQDTILLRAKPYEVISSSNAYIDQINQAIQLREGRYP
jgi:hypothetical protein